MHVLASDDMVAQLWKHMAVRDFGLAMCNEEKMNLKSTNNLNQWLTKLQKTAHVSDYYSHMSFVFWFSKQKLVIFMACRCTWDRNQKHPHVTVSADGLTAEGQPW